MYGPLPKPPSLVAGCRSWKFASRRIGSCEINRPAREFPVLFPQIALDNFGSSQES